MPDPQPGEPEHDKVPEKAPDAEKPEKPAPTDDLTATSDRIRETAKWLVATFGAVAGALIVGLQLSDIGGLEGSDRVIASLSAFGALVAVIMIIALASLVLARSRVPLSELSSKGSRRYKRLRAALNRNRSLYAGFESVEEFVDKVEAEWRRQVASWRQIKDHKLPEAERQKATVEYDETKEVMEELNKLNSRLLASARAEDIRLTFAWVRNAIVALALIVAIGGTLFALVDNTPDEEETAALPQRPVAARLHLDASGQDKLETVLGPACNLRRVPVEVLETSDEQVSEVVSIPAESCSAARMTIEPDDGELTAVANATLPAPTDPGGLEPPEAH
jgi:hypothetical protein